jgi:uncharacterized membrane protein YebE (DUF533 family)
VDFVTIEPWHMPILVMAGIILGDLLFGLVRRRWTDQRSRQRVQTVALGSLAALVIVVGVMALGPSLADQIASVAASVAGLVALWLTYRSYQLQTAQRPADPGPVDPGPVDPVRPASEKTPADRT